MDNYIEEKIKEFHKKYDFSENKTLEYDNLVGIADFIEQALKDCQKRERERVVEKAKQYKKHCIKRQKEAIAKGNTLSENCWGDRWVGANEIINIINKIKELK